MDALQHPSFAAFKVAYPQAYGRIAQFVRDYDGLLGFGWTHDDIVLAVRTGYNWRAHFNDPGLSLRWSKYARGPELMGVWHQHYYNRTKAELIGMSFDEFMTCWCSFELQRFLRETYTSLKLLTMYIRARRYGFSEAEARWIADSYFWRFWEYTQLRHKGFSAEQAKRLLSRKSQPSRQDIKYAAEALRRGATIDHIAHALTAYPAGSLRDLALGLRHAARQNAAGD